jgi:plastocyanin
MRAALASTAVAIMAGAPASASGGEVVAAPGNRYLDEVVEIAQGEQVTLFNRDVSAHDVTARAGGPDGRPLFASALVPGGGQGPVEGTQYLVSGDYAFACTVHPGMNGSLRVTTGGAPEPRPGATAADTTAPRLTVAGGKRLRVKLVSDEAVAATVVARRGRATLARGSARLDGGVRGVVELRLTSAGRKRLRGGRRVRVAIAAEGRDAAGNVGSAKARGVLSR